MNHAFEPPPDYTRREVEAAAGPRCPFYGMSLVNKSGRMMIPTGGNQCALITSAYSPCWMEGAEKRAPDWAACPRNPEFVTEVIRGVPAEARFNAHATYMDEIRVQRGIADALATRRSPEPG
jgi:hypothetical protein